VPKLFYLEDFRMATTRNPGVSYSRYSAPKQSKGDSEDRQEAAFRAFCERHHLTPLPEVYADRGRSGYKDEHRKKGKLGELIAAAKEGKFNPGTVIVVEAWDRLGRLRPDKQTALVAELLQTGVRIGVCRLDDVFREEDFGTHKWTQLAVFIQLAYEESKQKAERAASNWARRRAQARKNGQLVTTLLPAWLECVNGEVRLIPERAAAVRRIFQLAASGYGHKRIIAALAAEGVPPFGEVVIRAGRHRSQFSGRWTRPYIGLVLNDRRAVGEFQPRKADGTPEGDPVPGYFPAVVSEEQFLLAKAGQQTRLVGRKETRVRSRQRRYVNIFRGALRHARDGEGFILHNSGTAEKPALVLRNSKGGDGRGRSYLFSYPIFEEATLSLLREVKAKDLLPPTRQQGPNPADVLRARLANLRTDLAQIKEDLSAHYSKTLSALVLEKEAEEEQVAAQLQEELGKAAQPAGKLWGELPGLVDVLREAEDPDEVRLRLRVVLQRTVSEAWAFVVRRGCVQLMAVQFYFAEGGARRDYLVVYRPAGNKRAACWRAYSLKKVVKTGEPNLRTPEGVAALEAELQAVNLNELLAAPNPNATE
jgi:DNA invertase Pin-like site-specific DNA recombinase